jgi:hypothetical protein
MKRQLMTKMGIYHHSVGSVSAQGGCPGVSWGGINNRYFFWQMPYNPHRVALPEPVAKIYEADEELSALYPGRPFPPMVTSSAL